ncbi:hypothetical protein [Clostridium sp. JS66]|uniref:hypothetical protein n=1 Tax=Clostridium sp. JS66 TaxID=3064705 RepID=UPI00298E9952|nr:hypothetical protein [Clostridium sp. JS66]WPC43876.1 hypothetical protein Q6H37_10475 [Clostridium sp. JS66]
MIDNDKINSIIKERVSMHPDDPRIMNKWRELTDIFTENQEDTIEFLNTCSEENVEWISEVFEDISEILQSSQFISCIEKLNDKFKDLNLDQDIRYAKEVIE